MSTTRGKRAKFLNSTVPKKGRWSQKEVLNLKMAIYICGKEATPKELAQFVPSRDHEQIRKYIDRLKVSGDYETFVQGVEDLDLDNEPFGKFFIFTI